MAGIPYACEGAETPGSLRLLPVANITRDTATFDPAGGEASWACFQNVAEGSRDYRQTLFGGTGLTSTGPANTYKREGLGFAYRAGGTPAGGLAFCVAQAQFTAGGGTQQVENLCLTPSLTLEWYSSSGATTQGTASGTATAALASTTTWYWIWIDVFYPTAGGTITILVYIDGTLASTRSFTSTGGASAVLAMSIWGPSGTTPSSITGNIDNAIGVQGIDGSERGGMQWRCACVRVLVDGDGASNDFTASAGSRFQCVDESAPNDDTDYVSVDTTAAARQMFTMADPSAPTGYDRPLFVATRIRHKNGDAGKWAGNHVVRSSINGSATNGAALTDPGSTYNFPSYLQVPNVYGAAGVYLTPADVGALECGVDKAADASDAAQWRVTAVQAEISYVRYFHKERVNQRGVMRGVVRGVR